MTIEISTNLSTCTRAPRCALASSVLHEFIQKRRPCKEESYPCRPWVFLLPTMLMLIISLSACSPYTITPTPSPELSSVPSAWPLLSSAEMKNEYHQTTQNFSQPLPSGVTFPTGVPSAYDKSYQSEVGVGESIAYFYWMCAWQKQFIDALNAGDKKAQALALDMLESWKNTDFYAQHYDDPQDLWTKNMLTPARNGDPDELIEGYESGCSFYAENNG